MAVRCTVEEFGAVGDGAFNNTSALQRAIDACAEAGGGVVEIPAGVYRSGTIRLKSNVVLELLPGAEIRAVESLDAFPAAEPSVVGNFNFFLRHALIFADGADNVGIRGHGTINAMGACEAFRQTTWQVPDRYMNRPSAIRLVDCRNVRIQNVQIRDSAFWTLHLMACTDIVVHGINLVSRSPNYNNDGIDVDSCEDVRISDCFIDSEDDAISIKGTTARPCRRVMVNNCILSSHCNAVRVGAENFAAFEDIHFANCHIHNSGAGITFQNIDGYPMRRISFRGITMNGVALPMHLITNRKTYPVGVPDDEYPIPHGQRPAAIEDVVFDGIDGVNIGTYRGVGPVNTPCERTLLVPSTFSGHPDAPLARLTFRNVCLRYGGGGTEEDARERPCNINDRPNAGGKPYPVYGLLVRHARDVTIDNVRLEVGAADERPAVGLEFVRTLELHRLRVQRTGGPELVGLHHVEHETIANCSALVDDDALKPICLDEGGVFVMMAPFTSDER
jgi:hypothetical protein